MVGLTSSPTETTRLGTKPADQPAQWASLLCLYFGDSQTLPSDGNKTALREGDQSKGGRSNLRREGGRVVREGGYRGERSTFRGGRSPHLWLIRNSRNEHIYRNELWRESGYVFLVKNARKE
ncbi:hypothetical protein M8J75_002556 [Diaphorina citri]|nr:hypothetical protein M8J75_002556 [Diaphorina citri]